MELTIANNNELSRWMHERRQMGHDLHAIKGAAPTGATYSDGTPISRPVNVAWRDALTGDEFAIEYALPPNPRVKACREAASP